MDARDVYLVQPAPEDVEQHLERPITATIGTLNGDGSIHLAYVLFLWEEGRLYFETASMTKKARNVASRATASFAIEGKGFMAMAEGRGRIIDGEEAHAINGRLRRKYLTAPAAETVGTAWERWTTSPSRSPRRSGVPGRAGPLRSLAKRRRVSFPETNGGLRSDHDLRYHAR